MNIQTILSGDIVQYIISPIIVALCGYMSVILTTNRKTTDANAKGTMLLLRRQIISAHNKFVVGGQPMTMFDFEDLQEIHEAYKGLGGNGLTDKMWEDIKALDIVGKE